MTTQERREEALLVKALDWALSVIPAPETQLEREDYRAARAALAKARGRRHDRMSPIPARPGLRSPVRRR